ncbi:MAG: maleylpyruvate isomerase N-terminal domain-containing protein, partial [Carbonactinosporaceae bacterium]
MLARFRERRPELQDGQVELVVAGLRQWFRLAVHARRARGGRVALPSRAVHDLWHEFVFDKRAYADFCRQGLGRFRPYAPLGALDPVRIWRRRLQETYEIYRLACRGENLPYRAHDRLPLIFRIDGELQLPGRIPFVADCWGQVVATAAAQAEWMQACGWATTLARVVGTAAATVAAAGDSGWLRAGGYCDPVPPRTRRFDPVTVRAALSAQWGVLVDYTAELPAHRLDAPSRLPGWSVRQLVAHLALGVGAVRRGLAQPGPARPDLSLSAWARRTASAASAIDRDTREVAQGGIVLAAEVAAA